MGHGQRLWCSLSPPSAALSLSSPPRAALHWYPTRRAGPSTECAGVATSCINRPTFPLVGLDRRGIRSVYKHSTSSDSHVTGHGASRVAPTPRFGRQGYGQAGAGGWGWGGGVGIDVPAARACEARNPISGLDAIARRAPPPLLSGGEGDSAPSMPKQFKKVEAAHSPAPLPMAIISSMEALAFCA